MIWRLSGKIWKLWNGSMMESGLLACEGDGVRLAGSHGGGGAAWPFPWEKRLILKCREETGFSRSETMLLPTDGFSFFS